LGVALGNADVCRIRYPDPAIKVNDTVKIDLASGKITDSIKFDTGTIAMVTGGRNMGRVGVITHRERHDGGFNIIHLKDAVENEFATREGNVFVIGREKPWVSLPRGKGIKVRTAPPSVSCSDSASSPSRKSATAGEVRQRLDRGMFVGRSSTTREKIQFQLISDRAWIMVMIAAVDKYNHANPWTREPGCKRANCMFSGTAICRRTQSS
jgi:hypothetical protein